ncbi:hypothetical protein D1B33_04840 [Lysinibacillus yapensis]|uniref:Uncharacterized protein n=1 Tax=Ureibacillus yapensis TaxID=2304605 RepID=A0A396SA67_9BACL|nr:hypothetical protein [Lysinibacillus yapensis]RHW38218.1 hypothetical protein D1B33_04840 [Lysinibacillus yapensis]
MGGKNSGRRKGSLNKKVKEVNGVPSKICTGPLCNGNLAPVRNFGTNKSYCKPCQRTREARIREADYVGYKLNTIYWLTNKRMEKGKVYEVDSNLRSLLEELSNSQKHCYYSGIELTEVVGNPNSSWSPDRKNFKRGYVKDNIVLCTTLINTLKGNMESNFEKLVQVYGEETAARAFNNIVTTILESRKESVI